ncbi:MAG: DUF1330 domain-containing protein [Roseovarius sp.]
MAKGYWVVHVEVSDPEGYESYRAAVGPALAGFGGRFIVRGGAQEVREGTSRPRTVVVEFPSPEDARACYDSPAYSAARALREAAARADLVIVEGVED